MMTGVVARNHQLVCSGLCVRRAGMLAALAMIALALLFSDGVALARAPSLSRQVVGTERIAMPNKTVRFTSQCPASAPHPVGPLFGYVIGQSTLGSLSLIGSYPARPRGWTTQVKNLTGLPQHFGLGIVCLHSAARFAYPRVNNWVAGPGPDNGGDSNCPRSAPNPINNYFGAQSAADAGALLLSYNYPFGSGKAQGFATGIMDPTSQTVLFFAGTVCTSLRTTSSYFRDTVSAGSASGVNVTCPRRTPLAVSGSFYPYPPDPGMNPDNGNIVMTFTLPVARNEWSVGVASLTKHVVKYVGGAVCVGQ